MRGPRFFRSRGWKKLIRNRMAVASMWVIGLYLLVGVWIFATQMVNGLTGGALEDRPILGALLISGTNERVGPAHLPGFGLTPGPDRLYEAQDFYIQRFGQTLDGIEQLTDGSDRTPGDVLADGAIGSLRLADRPVEELKELRGRADDAIAAIEGQSKALPLYDKITGLCASLEGREADVFAAHEAGDDKALELALDELSLTLESVGFELEDYADKSGTDDALSRVDADAIIDAAEGVLDAEDFDGPLYDHDLIDSIAAAAGELKPAAAAQVAELVAGLEPIVDEMYPMPTGIAGLIHRFKLMCGTDRQGRSILIRAIYSSKIAIQVGVVTGIGAVLIGSLLGAAGAFFGGWVDHIVNWLFSTFSSIPSLVLLAVLAFMFTGSKVDGTLIPLYAAFGLTYWIGPCRVIRGEAMKVKELEYVQAATAIGFGRFYILLKHIIPNTLHLMFINFSLLFIAAVKGEVILTFLGLGLKNGASWGIMISQSKAEVGTNFFWQIGTATFLMFVLVLAFNIFTDALQDAFDPKHVS